MGVVTDNYRTYNLFLHDKQKKKKKLQAPERFLFRNWDKCIYHFYNRSMYEVDLKSFTQCE